MPEIPGHLPKDFLDKQGLTFSEVLKSLSAARDEFATRLEQSALNTPVSEGNWSPTQISDHLNTANIFFAKCLERRLQGKATITMPKGQITDDGRAISPAGEPRDGQTLLELLQAHQTAFEALEHHARTIEAQGLLETICVNQSFFGPLTNLEVLRLCAWHTRHHGAQISKP